MALVSQVISIIFSVGGYVVKINFKLISKQYYYNGIFSCIVPMIWLSSFSNLIIGKNIYKFPAYIVKFPMQRNIIPNMKR